MSNILNEIQVSGLVYTLSATTSGGTSGVTPEEVEQMLNDFTYDKNTIDDKIQSGVTVDVYSKSESDARYAKKEDVPSLSGYATQQWVEGKGYLTEHQSLVNYYTKTQTDSKINESVSGKADSNNVYTKSEVDSKEIVLNNKIVEVSGKTDTVVNNINTLSATVQTISAETVDFVDGDELSAYTYDKATIDSKIASGGTFDPTAYYNKHDVNGLLADKANTADTYTKTEVNNKINETVSDKAYTKAEMDALLDRKASYQMVYTKVEMDNKLDDKLDVSAYTFVEADYYKKNETSGKTEIESALNGKQDTLVSGTNIKTINNQSLLGSGNINIESSGSTLNLPISAGTGNNSIIMGYQDNTASSTYSIAEGILTKAKGMCSHTEGGRTTAENTFEHASGNYNVSSKISDDFGVSGNTLFSVGNGSIDASHIVAHNAFEIRQNGDIYISDTDANGLYYEKPMIRLQDKLNSKQDALTAGSGITITNNVISAKIWSGTQAEFDALTTKSNDTIYLIY